MKVPFTGMGGLLPTYAKKPVTIDDRFRGERMAGPICKFRAGQISSAIWEGEAKFNDRTVPMLRATVERRYKDRDGTWKSSGSFSRNEIPLAIYCLNKAFEVMVEKDAGEKEVPR